MKTIPGNFRRHRLLKQAFHGDGKNLARKILDFTLPRIPGIRTRKPTGRNQKGASAHGLCVMDIDQ